MVEVRELVSVKPLDWRNGCASTSIGDYLVVEEDWDEEPFWFIIFNGKPLNKLGEHKDEASAIAACQADYEQRILSALTAQKAVPSGARSGPHGIPCCKDIPNAGRNEHDRPCAACSEPARPPAPPAGTINENAVEAAAREMARMEVHGSGAITIDDALSRIERLAPRLKEEASRIIRAYLSALSPASTSAKPVAWRDVGYLMSIIDDAIKDGFDPDEDGPLLDEIRAGLTASPSPASTQVGVTEEMVEIAAKAMCREHGYDIDETMANDGPRWRYYVPSARAALTAALQHQES